MNNSTDTIEEKLLICESLEEFEQEILPYVVGQKQMWEKAINKILSNSTFTQSEIADMCNVSRMSINKWSNGSLPKNRETFIRLGLIAGYNVEELNEFLIRYGRYPKLYHKTLEDCVCIFCINNIKHDFKLRIEMYDRILERIKSYVFNLGENIIKDKDTDALAEMISNVKTEDELEEFIIKNGDVFKSAFNKFYAYVEASIYSNSFSGKNSPIKDVNRNENSHEWSSSLKKCISYIHQKKWYPSRNKVISLGIHLNMDHAQINHLLSLAYMEKLCARNPFEAAIIYALEDAALNDIVSSGNKDSLYIFVMDILKKCDLPKLEESWLEAGF